MLINTTVVLLQKSMKRKENALTDEFQTPGILSLADFWHLLEPNETYKLILMVTWYGHIYLQTDFLWLIIKHIDHTSVIMSLSI